MTNADKIRQMSDEQLARFLWIWKINSVTTFLTQGGMNSMDAKDMREWVGKTTETFVCSETFVGDDYIFDQDFNDKADRKTEPSNSEIPNNCEESQYEMGMGTLKCDNCSEYGSFKCTKCDGEMYFKRLEPKDEPQREVIMPKKCKGCDSASKIIEAYSRGFEDGADAVKAMPQTEEWYTYQDEQDYNDRWKE